MANQSAVTVWYGLQANVPKYKLEKYSFVNLTKGTLLVWLQPFPPSDPTETKIKYK